MATDSTTDNNNQEQKRPQMGQATRSLDTQVGRSSTLGVDLGMRGNLGPGQSERSGSLTKEADHGLSMEMGDGKVRVGEADGQPKGEAEGEPNAAADTSKEETTTEADQQSPLSELPPDFDPAKPETVEAYDKAFTTDGGKGFNRENLTADWMKNAKVDPKTGEIAGSLSEGTLKWLETRGVDRDTVQMVQTALISQMKEQRAQVFQAAGGQERYAAAVEWARKGGYSEEAQQKYNADLNAGGASRDDAVALLMQRFDKANPKARQRTPQRTMGDVASPTGGVNTSSVKPISFHDWQAGMRKARADGDQDLLNEMRARAKVSKWYTDK